ncbi:hypothetical protein ACWKSP_22275 [Micromonosporaceae bacterium Da 78-11]
MFDANLTGEYANVLRHLAPLGGEAHAALGVIQTLADPGSSQGSVPDRINRIQAVLMALPMVQDERGASR